MICIVDLVMIAFDLNISVPDHVINEEITPSPKTPLLGGRLAPPITTNKSVEPDRPKSASTRVAVDLSATARACRVLANPKDSARLSTGCSQLAA